MLLLRYLGYSILRSVAFAAAVLVGTGLIVHSLRISSDDDRL